MDRQGAQNIITTLKNYSLTAEKVALPLSKYNYREEAKKWHTDTQLVLIESECPTLRGIYNDLARHIVPIPEYPHNIEREHLLNKANIAAFTNYLEVSNDQLSAAAFNGIQIEPMREVATAFKELNLVNEARIFDNTYKFAYGVRQWYSRSKSNPGTAINIVHELNYNEATYAEQQADEGYCKFASLFKPSCNYSSSQKRALFNSLKDLYKIIEPEKVDKIVMAVILLFRAKSRRYKQPFITQGITRCKEIAMAAFGRDISVIKSYSENSLSSNPKLGEEHVKLAESIIKTALASTR